MQHDRCNTTLVCAELKNSDQKRKVSAVVTELNEDELQSGEIAAYRMACTNCGFVVRKSHLFLSEALLRDQIAAAKEQILKEYGIK